MVNIVVSAELRAGDAARDGEGEGSEEEKDREGASIKGRDGERE
jgi:hypothetical protein